MIVGGFNNSSGPLGSSDVYAPATETFSPGPLMVYARAELTATALNDGDVLIAGGFSGVNKYALPSTELFVP